MAGLRTTERYDISLESEDDLAHIELIKNDVKGFFEK